MTGFFYIGAAKGYNPPKLTFKIEKLFLTSASRAH